MKNRILILLRLLPVVIAVATWIYVANRFSGGCSWTQNEVDCLYLEKYAVIDPLYYGLKWLTPTLLVMAFMPWKIYRDWALTVLPVTLVISYLIISNISVYSSGILNITRAQMAVNCAVVLAVLSAFFVLGHWLYSLYKRRRVCVSNSR